MYQRKNDWNIIRWKLSDSRILFFINSQRKSKYIFIFETKNTLPSSKRLASETNKEEKINIIKTNKDKGNKLNKTAEQLKA